MDAALRHAADTRLLPGARSLPRPSAAAALPPPGFKTNSADADAEHRRHTAYIPEPFDARYTHVISMPQRMSRLWIERQTRYVRWWNQRTTCRRLHQPSVTPQLDIQTAACFTVHSPLSFIALRLPRPPPLQCPASLLFHAVTMTRGCREGQGMQGLAANSIGMGR